MSAVLTILRFLRMSFVIFAIIEIHPRITQIGTIIAQWGNNRLPLESNNKQLLDSRIEFLKAIKQQLGQRLCWPPRLHLNQRGFLSTPGVFSNTGEEVTDYRMTSTELKEAGTGK